MATAQHRVLLRGEAGGAELYKTQRPHSVFLYSQAPRPPRKFSFRFLTVAQSSEPSSSQASPPQQNNEQSSNLPSWAQPGSTEPPPWERKQAASTEPSFEVPFYAYLLGSVIIAIAAVGSIFEYFNKKPVFGAILPDSPFYAPILGFFVFTGFPAAAFLWFKSIELANKAARDQDREDGFLD